MQRGIPKDRVESKTGLEPLLKKETIGDGEAFPQKRTPGVKKKKTAAFTAVEDHPGNWTLSPLTLLLIGGTLVTLRLARQNKNALLYFGRNPHACLT